MCLQMKNKPHPRWVQSGSNSESEKWQSRQQTHAANGSVDSSDTSSTSAPLSPTIAESPSDSSGSCAQSACIPPPPYVFSSSELTYTPTDTTLNPNLLGYIRHSRFDDSRLLGNQSPETARHKEVDL